jgi:hypothetical protein
MLNNIAFVQQRKELVIALRDALGREIFAPRFCEFEGNLSLCCSIVLQISQLALSCESFFFFWGVQGWCANNTLPVDVF